MFGAFIYPAKKKKKKDVTICAFLFHDILNDPCLAFRVLVRTNKALEDITLSSMTQFSEIFNPRKELTVIRDDENDCNMLP